MELQTADTKKLERITDEPDEGPLQEDSQFQDTVEVEPAYSAPPQTFEDQQFQDTIETEPADFPAEAATPAAMEKEEPQYSQFAETTENFTQPPDETARSSDDGLLDLDDAFDETISDDVSLDLDFGAPPPSEASERAASVPQAHVDSIAAEVATPTEAVAILPEPIPESNATAIAPEAPAVHHDAASAGALSDEAIDSIARRVVEQISDKVVREIAWEVVPELSELLIKKKLEEQK